MGVIRIEKDDVVNDNNVKELNKNVGDPAKGDSVNVSDRKDESSKKPIEIVVDGPLGQTYTAILAAMYAKESMSFEPALVSNHNENTNPLNKEKTKEQACTAGGPAGAPHAQAPQADAYVYAVNADQLESRSGSQIDNELHIALDKNDAKVKYIAIEETKYNPKVNACLETFSSKGIKVIRNRNGLMKVLP